MKAPPTSVFVAIALAIAGAGPLAAHQTLYHNVEIYLRDPAVVRVLVTVHAPELPSGVAAGVDPSAVDENWLRTRPDPELSTLFEEADRFVRETFSFGIIEHGDSPLSPIDPKSLELEFETPDQIRDSEYDNGLPAGCFLVTFEFRNPGAPKGLAVTFSPKAEKRLLLAIARPEAFPEVHDLEAAGSIQIDLPEAPPPEIDWKQIGLIGTGMAAVALVVWLAFRRRFAR